MCQQIAPATFFFREVKRSAYVHVRCVNVLKIIMEELWGN